MYDGMINVCKEKGFTSHDVVAKLRGILHQKKIGHTGTLDPDATGVLPVCLGKGTKLCDMITDRDKTYRAVMMLGRTTDTQDISGQILTEKAVNVDEREVRDVAVSFVGDYMQIPPMYSAIKVDGKKLYELARAGQEVERKARHVVINALNITEIQLPYVTMEVSCSKGTYIRTLCQDIGEKLGCGACMTELVRLKVGAFDIAHAWTLAQIQEMAACGEEEVCADILCLSKKCFRIIRNSKRQMHFRIKCLPTATAAKGTGCNLRR
ncbi:MAG: tRNA pseudouridine(55) synthase TruB [Lachnospiraceae bacterium]